MGKRQLAFGIALLVSAGSLFAAPPAESGEQWHYLGRDTNREEVWVDLNLTRNPIPGNSRRAIASKIAVEYPTDQHTGQAVYREAEGIILVDCDTGTTFLPWQPEIMRDASGKAIAGQRYMNVPSSWVVGKPGTGAALAVQAVCTRVRELGGYEKLPF